MKHQDYSFSRRCFLKNACLAGGVLAVGTLAGSLGPLSAFAGEEQRSTSRGSGRIAQQTRLLMGTLVTLTALAPDQAKADAAFGRAFAEMERLIAVFDRRTPTSALSVLNTEGMLRAAPEELLAVLQESRHLGLHTEHAFNPAIAPVLDLFEAHKKAAAGSAPSSNVDSHTLAEALALARPGAVSLRDSGTVILERSGMRLTLDGIAKGYIADAASRSLAADGLANHMVNAGGDIRASGVARNNKPWVIGIQHPEHSSRIMAKTTVQNCGIATSGGYEQYYDRSHNQHHLISHLTGRSPRVGSVTVKASTAMQADALATALALMPPVQAVHYTERRTNAACLILDRQGQRYASRNWG